MLLDAATDLLLGGSCLGCDRPGWWLCHDCATDLTQCAPTQVTRPGFPEPIWAAGSYQGVLRRLLPAFKDAQAWQLGPVLGRLLATAIVKHGSQPVLVPLPSSPSAVRNRGDDHTLRLVRDARSWISPPPRIIRVLRVKAHSDQTTLSAEQRRRNLVGTMSARPGDLSVLICDDLVTTGASLVEARRALTEVGYRVCGAAVVGHTPRLAGSLIG